jgi:hypothetical protein
VIWPLQKSTLISIPWISSITIILCNDNNHKQVLTSVFHTK